MGLDQAMEGGFPTGTAIVVQGSPLTGIEHMARQFWNTEGETGVYLMLDTEPEEGMTDARQMEPSAFPVLYTSNRIVVDSLSTVILKYGIEAGLECLSTAKKMSLPAMQTFSLLFTVTSILPGKRSRSFAWPMLSSN